MNKKLYILFGLLASLFLLNVVQAEKIYTLDFETKTYDKEEPYLNVPYKDGYLVEEWNDYDELTIFRIYDSKGKIVKEKESETLWFEAVVAYEDDIYATGYIYNPSTGSGNYYLMRVNENFEIIKKVAIGNNYYNILDLRDFGVKILRVSEDKVSILTYNNSRYYTVAYNRELTDSNSITLNENNGLKNAPEFYALQMGFMNESNHRPSVAYKNGHFAIATDKDTEQCEEENNAEEHSNSFQPVNVRCYKPVLSLFTENGDKEWSKELDDYLYIKEVEFLDKYVAAVAMKYDYSTVDILIYDIKGNLLQTISSENGFAELEETPGGFIVSQGQCDFYDGLKEIGDLDNGGQRAPLGRENLGMSSSICCSLSDGEQAAGDDCVQNHQVYYLMRNIETKVDSGKGKIEVIKSSRPGEPVTFVITPEPGYVLSVVKVTDANGKVVTFTDNTFTMPTADVLIEATFVAKNPETKDIAITVIVLLAVIAGAVSIKRLKTIKNY